MKLIFVSNYFNHHQLPFCDALYELLEGDFCFLQTQPMEEERVKMGWQAEERPYVRYAAKNSCAHKSGVEKTPGSESNSNAVTDAEDFEKLLLTADVVIFGGCDDESYIQERLTAGKPIFRYNERLYKEGQWKAVSPRGLLQKYKDHTRYRKALVYFLCAGAYVPCDYHLIHAYPGKMLRFGYFPETRHYEAGQPFNHKEPGSILWAARMIDWKHPELVVKTAAYLKEHLEENTFHITMIGGGELEEETHRLAEELGVTDVITFPGFQGPEGVRAAMEKSEIYLVTSDRKEGWGAVVNEAFDQEKLQKYALAADDLWLKCMELLAGTKTVNCNQTILVYYNILSTRKNGLWVSNTGEQKNNDKVWKLLMEQYPEALQRLRKEAEQE